MDNHPIPQDITGFQFKLIGNMTVRQFAYLASGAVLAWISYLLPISFILKAPLILAFIAYGVSFAFVPVGGRPLDTMFFNLIRALFNPTQYIYQKQGGDITAPQYTAVQQNPVIQQAAPPTPAYFQQAAPPTNEEDSLLKEQEEVLEEEVKEVQKDIPSAPELVELQALLAETVRQKEELEKELLSLKNDLNKEQVVPTAQEEQKIEATEQPAPEPMPALQPVSSEPPNVVKGLVTDPRGNPLFNILVEVNDQEGNPVRAFKTNEKGQFASATTLPNGIYTVKLEDPKEEHRFDSLTVETIGVPLDPLNIKSIDQREELRRELFN